MFNQFLSNSKKYFFINNNNEQSLIQKKKLNTYISDSSVGFIYVRLEYSITEEEVEESITTKYNFKKYKKIHA